MCKKMYENNDYVYSELITETMWDAIMQFVTTDTGNPKTYNDLKNTKWGNYLDVILNNLNGQYIAVDATSGNVTSAQKAVGGSSKCGILTSASTETVKNKNIYDLAGNVHEWTQDVCLDSDVPINSTVRGGSFVNRSNEVPVCNRGSWRCYKYKY